MPPASLSTLAVMMPGPMTESTSAMRAHGDLANALTPAPGVSAMQHLLQHVVDGDHAEEPAVLLYRQRKEVVLRGELGDALGRVFRLERRRVLVHQVVDRRVWSGEEQVSERQDAGELAVAHDHEAVMDLLDLLGLLADRVERGLRGHGRAQAQIFGVHHAAG